MEAKYTVMSEEQISNAKKGHTAIIEAHPSVYPQDIAVAIAQAEISFKAGKVSERKRIETKFRRETIPSGSKAYSKDVIELLQRLNSAYFMIPKEDWQALEDD